MSDFQALFDAFSAKAKAERLAGSSQLTLGELILTLEKFDPGMPIKVERVAPTNDDPSLWNYGDVESYRGYYSDLYIDYTYNDERTVEYALDNLRSAVGETFEGYKGGDYTMSRHTPIWVDQYSCCDGIGVIGAEDRDGTVVILTEQVDK